MPKDAAVNIVAPDIGSRWGRGLGYRGCRPSFTIGWRPIPAAVFTVKLTVPLIARVRAHAAASGRTLSAVVAQALEEFLARTHRERPRR